MLALCPPLRRDGLSKRLAGHGERRLGRRAHRLAVEQKRGLPALLLHRNVLVEPLGKTRLSIGRGRPLALPGARRRRGIVVVHTNRLAVKNLSLSFMAHSGLP